MKIIRSPRFDRAYKKLPNEIKELFKNKFRLFISSNMKHPSLRVKRIKGTKDIWEASIGMNYRFTFQKIESNVNLRVICGHKVVEKP